MALKLIYVVVRNLLAWARLSRRDATAKNLEILILRHQLAVAQRRTPSTRAAAQAELGGPRDCGHRAEHLAADQGVGQVRGAHSPATPAPKPPTSTCTPTELKEKALARTALRPQDAKRYRPADNLLALLENL